MDLKQIQYFLVLYEEQSVTRAAQRLNIVQPALSMQIAKLELDIGRQLFRRSARGMTPTPAGDEMHAIFAPIVLAFTAAHSKVVRSGGPISGHVQVGIMASLGYNILPKTLIRFMADHPQVTLSCTEGATDTLGEMVANGQLDIAFINHPSSTLGLSIEQVVQEEILLVSSHNMPVDIGDRVELATITDRDFIMPTKGHGLRQLIARALAASNLSIIPALEVDSFMGIAKLVNEAGFLTFFPENVVRNFKLRASIDLRTHHLIEPGLHRDIVCATNSRRPLSAAAEMFSATMINFICDSHESLLQSPNAEPDNR